jgi:DNA ligase 1
VGNHVQSTSLSALVATSRAVAETPSRLGKIDHLSRLLTRLAPDELPVAIAYLSGATPQGRLGIGGAAIRQARDVPPADEPSLTLGAVDSVFAELASIAGHGSAGRRSEQLRRLLSQATEHEQDFLVRLLFGELRQGALEGVLVDAVARAAGLPAARVRRATMLAGDLAPVAAAAIRGGAAALDAFGLRVLQPVQPMLADAAENVDEALASLGDIALEYKLDGAHSGAQGWRRGGRLLARVATRDARGS